MEEKALQLVQKLLAVIRRIQFLHTSEQQSL